MLPDGDKVTRSSSSGLPRSQCPIGVPPSPVHAQSLSVHHASPNMMTCPTPHSLLVAAAVSPQYTNRKKNSTLNDRTETPQSKSPQMIVSESPGIVGQGDRSKNSPVLEFDQYDRLFIRNQQEILRTQPAGSSAVAAATVKIPSKTDVIQKIAEVMSFTKQAGKPVGPITGAIGPVDTEVSEALLPLQHLSRLANFVPSVHEDPNLWLHKPQKNKERSHHEKVTEDVRKASESLRGRPSSREVRRSETLSTFSETATSMSDKNTEASGLTETTTKSAASKKIL